MLCRAHDTQEVKSEQFLFPSRIHESPHISTRQYAKIVEQWVASIGLDRTAYGTHTMRRTKAALIYRRTKNLRAVQLLLGHIDWKVPCAISESKSMMHWLYLNKLRYSCRFNESGMPCELPLSGRQLSYMTCGSNGMDASHPIR